MELNIFDQFWSWRSKTVESGGKTPTWNETVTIPVKSQAHALVIKIEDEDLGGSHEAVAATEIAFKHCVCFCL